MNEKGFAIGVTGFLIPIFILGSMYLGDFNLIPPGYELAIDGYVISKNLILIALLYFISKLGLFIADYFQREKSPL